MQSPSGPANNTGAGAAARALGVVEIVDMIVDCLGLDNLDDWDTRRRKPYPKSRDDWIACGALARGVHRALRQAIDKSIARSLFDRWEKEVCHLSRHQPVVYLRIIANTPSTLAGTQSVRVGDLRQHSQSQKLRYITSIVCSLSASLTQLDVGVYSLSSLSRQMALDSHLAFPDLRTLIFRGGAGYAEGNAGLPAVLEAVKTLQTFSLLSNVTLDLAMAGRWEGSEENHYLTPNQMLVAMSVCSACVKTLTLRTVEGGVGWVPAAQLALLFRHFSGVQTLRLEVSRPVPLSGIISSGVMEIALVGPHAAMPDFLRVFLDNTEIPHLKLVPTLVIDSFYRMNDDEVPDLWSLTKRAVDALKARSQIQDDDEKYAALYRLGEYRGQQVSGTGNGGGHLIHLQW